MKKILCILIYFGLSVLPMAAQLYTPPIGSQFQGGIVAYVLQENDPGYVQGEVHGLIATPSDITDLFPWSNNGIVTGANHVEVTTGNTNTGIIVQKLGNTQKYAAKICADLVLNGYSDWYLPSLQELNKIFPNRYAIGDFMEATYWSSSEYDNGNAYSVVFTNGRTDNKAKNASCRVRAIRRF